jgi:hypothetical protein
MRYLLGCDIVQSNILTPLCRPPASEAVRGAVNPLPTLFEHVTVSHRRLHVPMPEQFLNGADVLAICQQVRGEQMAQHLAVGHLRQSDGSGGFFDGPLQR